MNNIGEIVNGIKSIIHLIKEVGENAVKSRHTNELRSILRAIKVAVDETDQYALLSKRHKKRNVEMEMEISSMWQGVSDELAQYIENNPMPQDTALQLGILRRTLDFKANGWRDPDDVDEADIAIYRASLKELRKTIHNLLKQLSTQAFRERR